jgi:short-subunit dehydrogenase
MFRSAACLITGASSGLGRALALKLAPLGARLVLTGRSPDRLDQTRSEAIRLGAQPDAIRLVIADLTIPDDRDNLFAHADDFLGPTLDLVVNAAGVGAYGRFESHEPDILRRVFELNVLALAEVCRLALPRLRRGRRPTVVNFGSIVARRALPGRAEYSASKHAVAALSDALRAEWAIDGIRVLLVNPGFTATAFERNVLVDTAYISTANRRTRSPDQVADATLRAIRRGRHEINLSFPGGLLLAVNRLAPRFVDWGLARWTRRLYTRARQSNDAGGGASADAGGGASASATGPTDFRVRPRASRPRP